MDELVETPHRRVGNPNLVADQGPQGRVSSQEAGEPRSAQALAGSQLVLEAEGDVEVGIERLQESPLLAGDPLRPHRQARVGQGGLQRPVEDHLLEALGPRGLVEQRSQLSPADGLRIDQGGGAGVDRRGDRHPRLELGRIRRCRASVSEEQQRRYEASHPV